MIPVAVALQLQLQLPLLLPHTIPAAVGSVLAVALAVGAELHGRRAYTGLAPDRVTRLWGHLIADAAPARGNAMRYRIRATAVAGGAQRAAADVELAVQVAAGPRLYRGQRVVLAGVRLGARGAATAMAVASTAAPLGFRSGTARGGHACGQSSSGRWHGRGRGAARCCGRSCSAIVLLSTAG